MRLPVQIGTGLGSSGGLAPSTPVLAVSSSGTTVTATITGSDSGVTNYLKYRLVSDTTWKDGGSRTGNGTISVASLSYNAVYVFVVYSIAASGAVSLPSLAKMVTLAATVDNKYDELLINTSDDFVREFGVTVKYLPSGGDERNIKAIVTRNQYQDVDGMRSANAPVFDVLVINDSATGISSSEINTGGDKIELAPRYGETATQRRITKILIQDAGMLKLEVR